MSGGISPGAINSGPSSPARLLRSTAKPTHQTSNRSARYDFQAWVHAEAQSRREARSGLHPRAAAMRFLARFARRFKTWRHTWSEDLTGLSAPLRLRVKILERGGARG